MTSLWLDQAHGAHEPQADDAEIHNVEVIVGGAGITGRAFASWRSHELSGPGTVSGPPWHLVARSVVDGVERCVSPDCPLQGSRFDADGAVLEGPATSGLSRWGRCR